MGYPQKIVTCCYCGARAALILDKRRHELACSSCGAPLHDLKMMPKAAKGDREPVKDYRKRKAHPIRKQKKKKRKGFLAEVFDEAFDLIEDIFD